MEVADKQQTYKWLSYELIDNMPAESAEPVEIYDRMYLEAGRTSAV